MSINYGVQPAKFEGNDTDLFAFSQVSNAYLFKVSISHILDCYNLILTGHFLENEGRGGKR